MKEGQYLLLMETICQGFEYLAYLTEGSDKRCPPKLPVWNGEMQEKARRACPLDFKKIPYIPAPTPGEPLRPPGKKAK